MSLRWSVGVSITWVQGSELRVLASNRAYSVCSLGVRFRVKVGYCPHPVTVYIKGTIKGYIEPYHEYYPTVTKWGQYPRLRA